MFTFTFPPLKQIGKNIRREWEKTITVQMVISGNGKSKQRGDKVKDDSKVHPQPTSKAQTESIVPLFLLFLQRHATAALTPEKTRYPLYRRLGGPPQDHSGRVWAISSFPGFDSRVV